MTQLCKRNQDWASNVSQATLRMLVWLLAIILGGSFPNVPTGILGNPDAKRLYDDLLSNYNRLIRPVGNNSDRLTVKLGLKLSQLIDVVSNFSLDLSIIFFLFRKQLLK